MAILTVQNLSKSYPSFQLKDVSFAVEAGQIMGFIGRNGAGKTTTLKCMLNLVHPDQGEMTFFGLPFTQHQQQIKQRIGFVSGGVGHYQKTKLDTLTSVTRRFYPNWDDAAFARYMNLFGLDGRKTPSQLSAGMRVKYALAVEMSHHAELLILDEPTSGLDPVSRDELLEIFLKLSREGVGILFSTHITSDLDQCADAITYIRQGQVIASEEISRFVGQYRCVSFEEESISPEVKNACIGLKMARKGYTALMAVRDAERLGIPCTQADLETIMIHMERE